MALKKYKANTPGTRGLVLIDKSDLHKGGPVKSLTRGKKRGGGRNNLGRMTTRARGGGHKQRYRLVDFKRNNGLPATVERLEYDPNRTAFIALIKYENGDLSYILAPQRLKVGDAVISADKADVKPGNCMKMANMPIGSIIHNIEMKPGKGGQLARSAGAYAQLVGRDQGRAQIKLMSGEVRVVDAECRASMGAVSNPDWQNVNLGKAGRNRWRGIRPSVRGVAMNPVDHPHGGGEGKASGGRHPVTPWGVPTKGKRTRTNKASDKFIIRRRYAKK